MVLGMSWAKPRSLGFSSTTPEMAVVDPTWIAERGRFVTHATADLVGGFPGYARQGGRLAAVDLRLYERALVVDEGSASGFALALSAIVAVDGAVAQGRSTPTLRIRYIDGQTTRLFFLTPRQPRTMRAARPEPSLLHRLQTLGAPVGPVAAISIDDVRTPIERQSRYAHEEVIWNGLASAPRYPGGDPSDVEIIVTTESLVWAAPGANTVDHVAMDHIRDVAPGPAGARGHLAVAYVGIGFSSHDRVEIPFVFDAHASASTNGQDRGALLGALRSRGVAVVEVNQPWQPWRTAVSETTSPAIWPAHVMPVAVPAALDEALRQAPTTPPPAAIADRARSNRSHADRLRPDRGVVVHHSGDYGYVVPMDPYLDADAPARRTGDTGRFSVAATTIPSAAGPTPDPVEAVGAPFENVSAPATNTAAATDIAVAADEDSADVFASDSLIAADAPTQAGATTSSAAARLEAVAISAINAALEAISRRRNGDWTAVPAVGPASDAERAAALAEVIDDMASGALPPAIGLTRKTRLESLADAAVRLHRALDEHAAGRVSIEDLVGERIRIDSSLTRVISLG